MALTITLPTIADGWLPAHNDINYTISSTQDSKVDFCYLIDVQVNGASVIKLRRYPLTIGQPIVLNVREIVTNFIKTTFPTAPLGFSTDYASIVLSISEFYDQETQSTSVTQAVNVWNASASFSREKKGLGEWIKDFTISRIGEIYLFGRPFGHHLYYDGNPLVSSSLLRGYELKDDAKANCNIINEGMLTDCLLATYSNDRQSVNGDYVVALGFDAQGFATKKYVKQLEGLDTNPQYMLYNIKVGTAIKERDFDNAYYSQLVHTQDFKDCEYICVYTTINPNADVYVIDDFSIKPLIFKVNHCKEAFGIHYASSEGGWGFIQCNKRMIEETAVEATTRLKTNSLVMNGWANDTRLVSATNVRAQGTLKLNSDWVEGALIEDIRDMLISPNIFVEHWKDGVLEYIPVTLVNASYITDETRAVNLRNYEFTFAESFFKNTIGGE